MSEAHLQEMSRLEETDPRLVEELLLKRKWRNVQKDPTRAINDQHQDTSSYWQALNQLPPEAIGKIVNQRILNYDKGSCDSILKRILNTKQHEDAKRSLQQEDRAKLREKLRRRHNQTLELEKYCGVRLGMPPAPPQAPEKMPEDKPQEASIEKVLASDDDLGRVTFT